MNTIVDIFICTCERDLYYFDQCVRSIAKFATGFNRVVVRAPKEAAAPAAEIIRRRGIKNWDVHSEIDPPGKGMVAHMAAIMRSDVYCHGATHICHVDSDCIFTEPVTPEDYFVDGKPVLMHASYDWLASQGHDLSHWKNAVETAIGGICTNEFMRRHPAVHLVELYQQARIAIEKYTHKGYINYILGTQNEYPWNFTEFVTLGEVAWRQFKDKYHWIDQENEPFPPHKLLQFWSHSPYNQPQDINNGGQKMHCTPLEVCERILG